MLKSLGTPSTSMIKHTYEFSDTLPIIIWDRRKKNKSNAFKKWGKPMYYDQSKIKPTPPDQTVEIWPLNVSVSTDWVVQWYNTLWPKLRQGAQFIFSKWHTFEGGVIHVQRVSWSWWEKMIRQRYPGDKIFGLCSMHQALVLVVGSSRTIIQQILEN